MNGHPGLICFQDSTGALGVKLNRRDAFCFLFELSHSCVLDHVVPADPSAAMVHTAAKSV